MYRCPYLSASYYIQIIENHVCNTCSSTQHASGNHLALAITLSFAWSGQGAMRISVYVCSACRCLRHFWQKCWFGVDEEHDWTDIMAPLSSSTPVSISFSVKHGKLNEGQCMALIIHIYSGSRLPCTMVYAQQDTVILLPIELHIRVALQSRLYLGNMRYYRFPVFTHGVADCDTIPLLSILKSDCSSFRDCGIP